MTGPSDSETHIEWLAQIVLHADRRRTLFDYSRPRGWDRRHWDFKASLRAMERTQ